jgi:hypothetical protein
VNTKGKLFNHYLHKLIFDEAKREGRKRRLEEQQQEELSRDNNFAVLTVFFRLAASSGSLAKHNIYELGEGLLAKVKEKEDNSAIKKRRIGATKDARSRKNSVRFQIAFGKYTGNKTLTREDLVALINKIKLPTDSANGKNIRELTVQWEQRKHRLNDYLGLIPNLPGQQNVVDPLIPPNVPYLPDVRNVVESLMQLNVPVDHNQSTNRIEI